MSFTPTQLTLKDGSGASYQIHVLPGGGSVKIPASALLESKDGAPAPLSHAAGEAFSASQHGLILLGRRSDAGSLPAGLDDGELVPASFDASGRLWVMMGGQAQVVGQAAHDAVAAGAPVLGGLFASNTEPADVADGDAVRAWGDRKGRAVVVEEHPPALASAGAHGPVSVNATASGNTEVIAPPGAGLSIHVTEAVLSNNGNAKVRADLRAGTTGTPRLRGTLAGDGGGLPGHFRPAWKLPPATALVVNLSAVGDVDVNVPGFYVAP